MNSFFVFSVYYFFVPLVSDVRVGNPQPARRHGRGDYIGEEVSQVEHALQAADLAKRWGEVERRILSYLVKLYWFS